ncbi:hypothetical protein PEC302107_26460 [Pectobacterium araliae]|uniref:Uncharacterized protein n=1 Tax=Pectobacterium araliae TaxID=3073862 RepID=A0AAN0MJT6_9GAMM|nr:hypothetical protein PEC302110_04800 [Pectobacterium sp. MAFF 302110]GKW20917.1 hypothetical protein PEC302107_26460 [Pectobacterium carotovorum subsp. carotovorum]
MGRCRFPNNPLFYVPIHAIGNSTQKHNSVDNIIIVGICHCVSERRTRIVNDTPLSHLNLGQGNKSEVKYDNTVFSQ